MHFDWKRIDIHLAEESENAFAQWKARQWVIRILHHSKEWTIFKLEIWNLSDRDNTHEWTLTDWRQDRCVSLRLCARRVWLILFALQICDICRSDRGLVLHVTCVQSRLYILYHRCRGQHLSLYVHTCDCLSYIYTVCFYSYNGSSSYMIYLQSVCILFVKWAVREAAGLSAQWPFTSVMLVMPVFLFLSAPQ